MARQTTVTQITNYYNMQKSVFEHNMQMLKWSGTYIAPYPGTFYYKSHSSNHTVLLALCEKKRWSGVVVVVGCTNKVYLRKCAVTALLVY